MDATMCPKCPNHPGLALGVHGALNGFPRTAAVTTQNTAKLQNPENLKRRRLYRTARWVRLRATYLANHPHCRLCRAEGRLTFATIVDHVAGHQGPDWEVRFWSWDNLQGLCASCHNRKGHAAGELRGTLKPEDAPLSFAAPWPGKGHRGGGK